MTKCLVLVGLALSQIGCLGLEFDGGCASDPALCGDSGLDSSLHNDTDVIDSFDASDSSIDSLGSIDSPEPDVPDAFVGADSMEVGDVAETDGAKEATVCATTCQSAGKNCGSIPDGCGGTLNCGSCAGSCESNVCNHATQLALGVAHSCALMADSSVRCWGANYYGQLGNGTTNESLVPTPVLSNGVGSAPLTGVLRVISGVETTCALMKGGSLECWGSNADGELGVKPPPDTATKPVVISMSPASQATISYQGCAVLADFTARCWGFGPLGALGDGIAATAVSPPTTVVASGSGLPLGNVEMVSSGDTSTCAVSKTGSVYCWGDNSSGQLAEDVSAHIMEKSATHVAALSNARQVAVGNISACALLADSTVQCWGANSYGQLGRGGFDGDTNRYTTPAPVMNGSAPLSGIATIFAGQAGHVCARKSDDSLWCWGRNSSGQIGNGSTSNALRAIQVLSNVSHAAVGGLSTCALQSDGVVQCWGANTAADSASLPTKPGGGQLGDGTKIGHISPMPVKWQ